MITSNINELIFRANIQKEKVQKSETSFLDEVKSINTNIQNSFKTNSLSFENIDGITLEEIDSIFTNEKDKELAKNLRLATLFTDDKNLAKAMFNTVLGKPFILGSSFLSNMYDDKHNYFKSINSNNNLSDLLYETIANKTSNQNLKPNEVISQEKLDEILLSVQSFNFLDTISKTYKDKYDNYNEEEDYSFLYNDFNLQYEQLIQKYKDVKNQINRF